MGPFGTFLLAITIVEALDGMHQKDHSTKILTAVSPVENTNFAFRSALPNDVNVECESLFCERHSVYKLQLLLM